MERTDSTSSVLRASRWLVTALAIATAALGLSACGGGGDSAGFSVTAVVAGQTMGDYGPDSTQTLYVHTGQSFELDANEPVEWTLYVGNTAVSGVGTDVNYAGADVTLVAESSSRIAVSTYAAAPLLNSVPITLVATSTIDSAQVSTVDVLITN